MADELENRLEAEGQRQVPRLDQTFADRLESQLRVEHAEVVPTRQRRAWAMLPRVAVAALIVVAGIVGLATLAGDDATVPVAVVDEEPAPALDAAGGGTGDADAAEGTDGSAEQGQALADPTNVPTPSVSGTEATPVVPPIVTVTATPVDEQSPTAPATAPTMTAEPDVDQTAPTPLPVEPTATAAPSPTVATPTSTPTVTPEPTPTPTPPLITSPVPVPTTTAVPTPTTTPSPTPEPTPTVERAPVDIELACGARVVGDVVGVVCSWDAPVTDRVVASYQVMRSRNGGEAEVVSRQRASTLSFTDRGLSGSDEVIYLVQGLDSDSNVVATSVREVVVVPEP